MTWNWTGPVSTTPWDNRTPLTSRVISRYDPASDDVSPGKRLRAFAALVAKAEGGVGLTGRPGSEPWLLVPEGAPTYGDLLAAIESGELAGARDLFAALPLRCAVDAPLLLAIPGDGQPASKDPELHLALQDLGNEINEDVHEALQALDDPHHWFPGVDEGIEPVTDDHVQLVTWALQRELDRERRSAAGFGQPLLPPAPLAGLPWPIQRAIAERRRLRYQQFGIGKAQWQANAWSLWDVPADPEFVPRRAARLAAIQSAAA
ncbi:MAG: hypothetical protein ACKVT1_03200 [Dehalococcoidia bacterium]